MNKAEALNLDISGNTVLAAKAYEEVITSVIELDTLVNLAFIYWQSTDYGFHINRKLDLDFVRFSSERYLQILEIAADNFEDHPNFIFWKRYFNFIDLGEPEFSEVCEKLILDDRTSHDSFFYLFTHYNGLKYEREAKNLLNLAKRHPTHKNEYIRSVIEGVITRKNYL